ncbi:hypothetical protein Tcur_1550 [Thermomonospora curvata DSM 43183]|uniref:Uncharacterized protein n=1 Tax=Thermomonospora curvata (strain ATCC 19995 / DSM 43183 / JCM 3096 / KCTC 9072 / NBRC 15933 / NCIMB 10081 / Henssen B9) TaxID=471852 RepID=D1AAW6_THECD|nr:hypothetical protein Tcur_1550 [Thermomonospora curvata DSM 43183]
MNEHTAKESVASARLQPAEHRKTAHAHEPTKGKGGV